MCCFTRRGDTVGLVLVVACRLDDAAVSGRADAMVAAPESVVSGIMAS